MAAEAHDYHRGEMDVAEQASTFHGFIVLSKWGSLAIVTVLLFFILWICAHATVLMSVLASVVTAVAGVFLLKEKKSAGH